jgi:phosphomannomutase
MRIAVDCGNGVAGATAPELYQKLGCNVEELFCEVDGSFPNHHPDPSQPHNLEDLIAALKKGDAEIGLAFDGDGDRLGVVTKSGKIIYPDRQLMLFAADVLSRVPGGEVIFDVKCTRHLFSWITKHGGKPVLWKTGHSFIKKKLKESGAPLAGEMSGHIFFKERWYGFDDGTYAGCRLLEIVSRSPDANALLQALPTSQSTPELNVACVEGEPHRVTAELLKLAQTQGLPSSKHQPVLCDIDGVRIDWTDGFGLVRASNTTPVLVLRFEGQTPQALARIETDMMALLRQVKPDAQVQEAAH